MKRKLTPKYPIRYDVIRPSYSKPKRQPRKSFKFLLALFILAPWLAIAHPSTKTIYAEPSQPAPVSPLVQYADVKMLQPIKEPALKPVEALEALLHKMMATGTYSNAYAAGQCTWGVASRLPVPQDWGNANTWDDMARAEGYTVSTEPKVGAIAVSENDSYWGHVAIVTSTSPLTVWEMNYSGPYSEDTRPANPGEFTSFIYF